MVGFVVGRGIFLSKWLWGIYKGRLVRVCFVIVRERVGRGRNYVSFFLFILEVLFRCFVYFLV